jgi:KDO2-lipid IV(A) lauroyltransferase
MKKQRPTQLWHPVYWPTHLGLFFVWLINKLPLSLQRSLGALFGRVLYYVAPDRRHVAKTNIRMCFPELSAAEQAALVKSIFKEQGIALIESGMAWWPQPERLIPLGEVIGFEHVQKAQQEGKGILFLSAHFTSLDITGGILAQHMKYDGMYRKNNNPVIEKLSKQGREQFFEELIEKRDIRKLVKRLREGKAVWYAPDQDLGMKLSVYAPFFGVQAATITATARIAKMSGCAVIPLSMRRSDEGRYIIEMQPPLEDFPTGDDVADATRVNEVVEGMIRKSPAQYMWVHRRFKSHPEGKGYLYKEMGKE